MGLTGHRVLVTGAAGFIGLNLGPVLARRGYTPTALDLPDSLLLDQTPRSGYANTLTADIRRPAELEAAMSGVDIIIHLAAQPGVQQSLRDPAADRETNVDGTLNVLVAASRAGARHVVFASSNAVLGDAPGPLREDRPPGPRSPYGAAKVAGEAYVHAFMHAYSLAGTVLRFSNVYGPFSDHKRSVVPLFLTAARKGDPIVVYGSGEQTRDFVFVGDICEGIVNAVDRGATGVFQLGTGVETSINRLAGHIADLFPTAVSVVHEEARAGDVSRSVSDITKAQRDFDYRPATALVDGLRITSEWFAAFT